jgi:hypothetical protein
MGPPSRVLFLTAAAVSDQSRDSNRPTPVVQRASFLVSSMYRNQPFERMTMNSDLRRRTDDVLSRLTTLRDSL